MMSKFVTKIKCKDLVK